jgi:hypothetical protein
MAAQNKNTQYFRTSSFYTCVFLIIKGLELAAIEKTSNSRRSVFVIKDSLNREKLIQSFNFAKENAPEVLVDFRRVITVIKGLKDKLYQERR